MTTRLTSWSASSLAVAVLLVAVGLSGCKTEVERGGTPGGTTSNFNPSSVNATNGGGGPVIPTESSISPNAPSSSSG